MANVSSNGLHSVLLARPLAVSSSGGTYFSPTKVLPGLWVGPKNPMPGASMSERSYRVVECCTQVGQFGPGFPRRALRSIDSGYLEEHNSTIHVHDLAPLHAALESHTPHCSLWSFPRTITPVHVTGWRSGPQCVGEGIGTSEGHHLRFGCLGLNWASGFVGRSRPLQWMAAAKRKSVITSPHPRIQGSSQWPPMPGPLQMRPRAHRFRTDVRSVDHRVDEQR